MERNRSAGWIRAPVEGAARHRYHPQMLAAETAQGQTLRLRDREAGRTRRRAMAELLGWKVVLATAVLGAMWLYLPALEYGFVFDDGALIGPDGWPVWLGGAIPYRPLRYGSYLLDALLGGSATIYHAHNVLLHGLVVALMVLVARRLGSKRLPALIAGLLVAWHPLAVEVVAYVAGRRDLLCAALGLAAVLAQLSGRGVAALGLFLLSVAAKESGLVFSAPLLATSVLWRNPRSGAAPRAAWLSIAAAVAVGVGMVISYGAIGPWGPLVEPAGLALPGRVAEHYLAGVFGLRSLGPEYPELLSYVAQIRGGDLFVAVGGVAGTLLLMAVSVCSVAQCRAAAQTGQGLAAALVLSWIVAVLCAIAIWGGLHEPGVDRHAYLLLAPIGIGLALLLSRLPAWTAPAPLGVACAGMVTVVLLTSATTSRSQMEIWRSERSLWMHAAARPLASVRSRVNVARVLAASGSYGEAIGQLTMAITQSPNDAMLFVSRSAVRCAKGRPGAARRDWNRARTLGAPTDLLANVARECSPGASS